MVGEEVITIGNAFGYENTVSIGIISALKRNVTLSDDQVYRNLIQTDACINPGNSGGPLININGELIGINVAVRSGAQGIGFALPIDDVKRVASDLLSTRRVVGTWHGLAGEEVIEGEVRAVFASEVKPASPSFSAGIQPGDKLVRIGSTPIQSSFDIERSLLEARPDSAVPITVSRRGKELVLGMTVEALPRTSTDAATLVWQALGVKASPVGPEHVSAISPRLRGGLLVESVYPNGPAARSSIAPGDILVGMHVGEGHWETIQPDNVVYILDQYRKAGGQPLQYYLIRQKVIHQGAFDLTKTDTATATTTRR
jgi:serine protease Do